MQNRSIGQNLSPCPFSIIKTTNFKFTTSMISATTHRSLFRWWKGDCRSSMTPKNITLGKFIHLSNNDWVFCRLVSVLRVVRWWEKKQLRWNKKTKVRFMLHLRKKYWGLFRLLPGCPIVISERVILLCRLVAKLFKPRQSEVVQGS